MGFYASGQVFYGYLFDEDTWFPEDGYGDPLDEFNLAEKIARNKGIVDPWDTYPNTDNMDYDAQDVAHKTWHIEHAQEIDEWYDAIREIERTVNVEMSSYGHCDYSAKCLVIKGTSQCASPSYPVALDTDLQTDPDWVNQLDAFLEAYGMTPPEDGPCWWLVASYG
jgi:hypothetical protein